MFRPGKPPKSIGRTRGTKGNLRNQTVKYRNNVFKRKTMRREVTRTEKRYTKLSNISWTLFKIASNWSPVVTDPDDIGKYEYDIVDCVAMSERISRKTSNPFEVNRILNEELEMFRTKTGKYAAPIPIGEILVETFRYGNAVTNGKYERVSTRGPTARSCSLLALVTLLFISLGRADAAWYSVHVPPEEQNIANNIAVVSNYIGYGCMALSYIPTTAPIGVACVAVTSAVTAGCSMVDMSVRFMDDKTGMHPLTNAQRAKIGVNSALGIAGAIGTSIDSLGIGSKATSIAGKATRAAATAVATYAAATGTALVPTAAALDSTIPKAVGLMASNVAGRLPS